MIQTMVSRIKKHNINFSLATIFTETKKINILILLFFGLFFLSCDIMNRTELDKKEKESARNANALLFLLNSESTSDCIFCTDTQANQGNCTCYSKITLGTCQGFSLGKGKSNSYRISCEALVSKGIWTLLDDGSQFCPYQSCPVEAYRAAFTAFGE